MKTEWLHQAIGLRRILSVSIVSFCFLSMHKNASAQQGWYPHEGGLLKYRVNIRFGEEPDTMPDGWKFGRVSAVATDSKGEVYVFHRGKKADPIVVFDGKGRYLRMWTHLGATQNVFITPSDEMWIITHRSNIENITYDTLAGRIMKIDLPTGKILGAMESPGHWIHMSQAGEIFIGSLTGNVFRWYPGWLDRGLGVDEGITSP